MICFIRVLLQNHPAMMTNLLYPAIPAVDKLLLAHTPVPRDVEDHKQVADLLGVHPDTQIVISVAISIIG